MSIRPITVTVATRNRPDAVDRCLRSLASIRDLVDAAIVYDDASDPPLDGRRMTQAAEGAGIPLELLRGDALIGTSAARNMMARRARAPYVLGLDDDAFLVGDASIREALAVLQSDPGVAAVAFPQADASGRKWPAGQQPSAAEAPCYVPSFIGFASLVARDRLLEIGGYRETFMMHGEEREVCLRWLDRGLHVVYLPGAPIAHVADASNRDQRTYVRHVMRNDCLAAIYNQPLARAAYIIPYKFWSFTRMRAGLPDGDPGGLTWLIRELLRLAPELWRERRPVRWRTVREWARLRDLSPPYPGKEPGR